MSNFPEIQNPPGPTGIGGWLILPMIGFVGTILFTLKNLVQMFRQENWDGLVLIFNATSGSLVTLKVPMALSFLAGFFLITSASYCLFLIFVKKPTVAKMATVHYLILMAASLVELWGEYMLQAAVPGSPVGEASISAVIRVVIGSCIWIAYFRLSKRVKNTFTPQIPPP